MRFLFRWAFRLFLVALVLIVALVLLKDVLLKSYAERQIRSQTGLEVKLGRLEAGLFSPTLTVENLKLYNTAEFGGSPLLDVPELHLAWSRGALARRQLHFKLVRVHINEINIVENQAGRTNITGFVAELQKLSSTNSQRRARTVFEFGGIEMLNLTLGRIKYSSLKRSGSDIDFQVLLKNEILTNVQTLPDLADLILNVLLNRGITITSRAQGTSVTVNPKRDARWGTNQTRPALAPAPRAAPKTPRESRASPRRNAP